MDIESYFRNKGPSSALTKAEALVLGFPFPARGAWLLRYGSYEITPEQERIRAQLTLDRQAEAQEISTTADIKQMSLFEEL
jgi:hypothetical protein